jgi:hypothetical protein
MVRHELIAALTSGGLTLVPTLVEGADVPKASTLPAELRPLFDTWNARRVTEDGLRVHGREHVEAAGRVVSA